MDHEFFRERIAAWHDKELSPEEQHLLDEHIKSCPECRKLAARYERLDALAGKMSHLGGDEDYWEQSAARIEARLGDIDSTEKEAEITDIRSGSGLWWKIAGAVAAALVLTFIGLHQSDILDDAGSQQDMAQEVRPTSLAVVTQEGGAALEEPVDVARPVESPATEEKIDRVTASEPETRVLRKDAEAPPPEPKDEIRAEAEKTAPKQTAPEQANAIRRAPIAPPIEPEGGIQRGNLRDKLDLRTQSLAVPPDSVTYAGDDFTSRKSAELDEVAATQDSLVFWQASMDSLSTLATDGLTSRDLDIAYAQEAHETKARGSGQATGDIVRPHQRLLLAAYNVARLTDDQVVYQRAVEILRRYRQLDHQLLSEQAGGYLRLVEHRFPDEP